MTTTDPTAAPDTFLTAALADHSSPLTGDQYVEHVLLARQAAWADQHRTAGGGEGPQTDADHHATAAGLRAGGGHRARTAPADDAQATAAAAPVPSRVVLARPREQARHGDGDAVGADHHRPCRGGRRRAGPAANPQGPAADGHAAGPLHPTPAAPLPRATGAAGRTGAGGVSHPGVTITHRDCGRRRDGRNRCGGGERLT